MSHVFLLGDSHIARINGERRRFLARETGHRVANAGVGGASCLDLVQQLQSSEQGGDIVVVSVGTNDAAPWKQISLDRFEQSLKSLLPRLSPSMLIYLASPGVDEGRLVGSGDRTNEVIRAYTALASQVFADHGGTTVDSAEVLSRVQADVYEFDGVHVNDRGYECLLRALARAIGDSNGARERTH